MKIRLRVAWFVVTWVGWHCIQLYGTSFDSLSQGQDVLVAIEDKELLIGDQEFLSDSFNVGMSLECTDDLVISDESRNETYNYHAFCNIDF